MRLDRYTRAGDFLAAVGDFLGTREAEHNLIFGVADSAARAPELYEGPPYLAAVSDGDGPVAAALRTPPYNLLLSEVDDPAAIGVLLDDLAGTPLPGVTGPPSAVRDFADRWVGRHGGSWRAVMDERIYALERVIPPRPVGGAMRDAGPNDRELIRDWLDAFAGEAMAAREPTMVQRTLAEWERGDRRFWLWGDRGAPVSLVGGGSPTPRGVRIGPVYTPPSRRGRGYASSLTAAVSQRLLDEGRRFCFLYTDLANPTSNRIYQAIGYRPVTDALMVAFDAE